MSNNPFIKATKTKARLRMAFSGASGSGKTYSALNIAQAFGKVAVIDTEHGSASKYADRFEFDVLELNNYHPQKYIDALNAAAAAGYDVVIIDSLSHAWNGAGGVLEIVDKAAAKSESKNTFSAWRDATPLQQKLVEALLSAPLHIIATMRSKTEYVLELDKRGKMSPRKVGTAPIQRDGIEYEFDVVGEMNADHHLLITKTRVPMLADEVIPTPGKELGDTLLQWLSDGADAPPQPATPPQRVEEPAPNSVRGAGIPQRQQEPPPAYVDENGSVVIPQEDGTLFIEDPPNVHHISALIVSVSKTAKQFAVKVESGAVIHIEDMAHLSDKLIGDKPVATLDRGSYAVEWTMKADKTVAGWDVQSIVDELVPA